MPIAIQFVLLMLATSLLIQQQSFAQVMEESSSSSSSESSSTSSSSSSSSSSSNTPAPPLVPSGPNNSQSTRPVDTGTFSIPTEKTSITFIPKFKQRINDLSDQVRMVQGKGFITSDEAAGFLARTSQLLTQEADASKKGFPKPDIDALEKAITLLNADLFKAMRKSDPVKPGASEKEVNDPNLIPAYSDPELQPGSGKVDPPKN